MMRDFNDLQFFAAVVIHHGFSAAARALSLPTFEVAGVTLIKCMVLVIDDGVIAKAFYPVFPPDESAAEVVGWLHASK